MITSTGAASTCEESYDRQYLFHDASPFCCLPYIIGLNRDALNLPGGSAGEARQERPGGSPNPSGLTWTFLTFL